MSFRGVRGATVASENSSTAILEATSELLQKMIAINHIKTEEIASIFLSTTRDLDADFPAKAARNLGLNEVPLLCLHEMEVPGALKACIRILIHINTDLSQAEIQHVYLKEAQSLRPDHVNP